MGRRLVIAMVAVVAAALVLAGLGSLLLARHRTVGDDVRELATQASDIGSALAARENAGTIKPGRLVGDARLIAQVTSPFLTRVAFVVVGPEGGAAVLQSATTGETAADQLILTIARSNATSLRGDRVVSGTSGARAFALAPLALDPSVTAAIPLPSGVTVVIALVTEVNLPAGIGWYFLLAAAVCLVGAAVVALLFARRLERPLTLAVRTTRRIAAGDLEARMPVERTYPEVEQLGESINAMAEELARSRATERQFVLSVSHDLRTPLTSIRGYAEAIADGAAPDPVRAATVIASEAGRLERLFQDLLDLARLDARRFAIDVRRVDLPEVAGAAAEGLRIRFEEAGLTLAVDPPAGALPVAADPDRLAQVVTNLLENARKFARAGARVATVPVPAEPGMAVVVVEDDGPGIPVADLPHVFERFYTGSTRDRSGTGTGLGLAIVSELVHAMGGSVSAVSPISPAGGTRMVVRLTRWAGGPPPSAPPAAPAAAAPGARDGARPQ